MIATAGGRQQDVLDLMQRMRPIQSNTNINDLSDLMNKLELLKTYKSRASEAELSPDLARARSDAERMAASDFEAASRGDLSPSTQRALAQETLMSSLATGAPIGSSKGGGIDFGARTAATLYGRNADQYLNAMKNQFQNYLKGNPAPQGGIDPSSAANIKLSEAAKNQNLENAFRQQLVQGTANAANNMTNMAMGLGQSAAAEDQANTAAQNAFIGRLIGMAGSVAGGPLGGMAGNAIGNMIGGGGQDIEDIPTAKMSYKLNPSSYTLNYI
jgi:hypothetical protein